MAEICRELHEKAHKHVRNIVFSSLVNRLLWLIELVNRLLLRPSLIDIFIVACILLPCATCGTNFKVNVI